MDDIDAEQEYKRKFPVSFVDAFDMLRKQNGDSVDEMAEKLGMSYRTMYDWLREPERKISIDFVVKLALLWRLPDWISELLLDRAYVRLSDSNRRHLALKYILKVLWSEGVEKANEYLASKKLDPLGM